MESNGYAPAGRATPSSNSPLRRVRRIALVSLGALVALYLLLVAVSKWQALVDLQNDRSDGSARQGVFEDYIAFYTAGKLVLDGQGSDLYDLDVIDATQREIADREADQPSWPYFNPPFVAVMFAPLALLPLNSASLGLMAINAALILVAGLMLHSLLGLNSRLASALFWLALLSLESVFRLMAQGQVSMLLLMGFLGFFWLQRQGKHGLSGAALALLLIKPQMAVVAILVLAYKRRWSELRSFAFVAAALGIVSVAASGPSVLWEYPRFALAGGDWEEVFNWDVTRMFGLNGLIATGIDSHSPAHLALTVASSLLVIGLAVAAFRGPWQPASPRFALGCAAIVAASILINPHIWMHDTVSFGLVAIFGFLGWQRQRWAAPLWVSIGALIWLAQEMSFRVFEEFAVNVQTPLLLAVFLLVAWQAIRLAADSARAPIARQEASAVQAAA